MKRIVIAGGNSFIARHLLSKMNPEIYQCTVLVRDMKSANVFQGLEYIELSMNNYIHLVDYISSCDTFIPFAWFGNKSNELNDVEKNKTSCQYLFDAIKSVINDLNCRKIILPGSMYEYDNTEKLIDEDTESIPRNAYGQAKWDLYNRTYDLCCESNVLLYELRLFSVCGIDDSEDKFFNTIVRKLKNDEEILLTRGEQMWSFISVDDVADVFLRVIEDDPEPGIYNITPISFKPLREWVEIMKEALNSKSIIRYGAIPYSDGNIPHMYYTSLKTEKNIKWKAYRDIIDLLL